MMTHNDNGNNMNGNEEWIAIDDPLEYIEITMDDVNIENILEEEEKNDRSMNSEEYIVYLKALWNKERENKQKLMNEQMDRNNALQQQLNVVKKQNIKLQKELNFVNLQLKNQQNINMNMNMNNNNNNNNKNNNNNNDLNVNDNQNNVVSKIWNVFRQKSNNQNTINLNQKLEQMEETLNNVQHLHENMNIEDMNDYKKLMNQYMSNLFIQFQDLSKSIAIK